MQKNHTRGKFTLSGALVQLPQDSLLPMNLYFRANTLTVSNQNKWFSIHKKCQRTNKKTVNILNSSHLSVIPVLSTSEK